MVCCSACGSVGVELGSGWFLTCKSGCIAASFMFDTYCSLVCLGLVAGFWHGDWNVWVGMEFNQDVFFISNFYSNVL